MAITMDGIFVNGQKATFRPEDILSGDASAYTEEIGAAVEAWMEENVTGGEQVTDTTLTLPGVPADAEKTGDEIEALKEDLNDVVPYPELPDSKYGTSGQILRTKGNGKTEWSNVGLPTDEQTAEAVSAWLDAHPEATTTVEDGSLTYEKLVVGTLNFVTPEMFGAVGDGVADDTNAVQAAINTGLTVIGSCVYKIGEPNHAYYYPVVISVDGTKLIGKFVDGRTYLTTSNNKDYGAFLIDADNVSIDIEIVNDNELLPDDSQTANNLSDVGGYAVTIADGVKNANVKVRCEHMNGVYGKGIFTNADISVIAKTSGYPYAGNVALDSRIQIDVDGCHRAFWGAVNGCYVLIQSKNFYSTGNSSHVLICAVKKDGVVYHGENSVFDIIDTGSTIYNSDAAYANVYNDIGEDSTVLLTLRLTGDISNSNNRVFTSNSANSEVISGNVSIENNMKIDLMASGAASRHYSACNLSVIDHQYSRMIIDTTADIIVSMRGVNPANGAVYFTHLGAGSKVSISDYNSVSTTTGTITINAYQFFEVVNVFTFNPANFYRCTVTSGTKYLNGNVTT